MTDKEKLNRIKKLADAMYTTAQYLSTDASRLRKAMEEYHKFIIYEYNKQEPASDDLDAAIERYIEQHKSELSGYFDIRRIAKHFADWQREQMMKGTIDTVVVESYGVDKVDGKWENVIHPKIEIESDKLSIGDKVKVIIIKE